MRKLIYIMGNAHCGSTLLTTLLGRHSQIATVGELKMTAIPDFRNYQCGCGEELLACAFWKQVATECLKSGTKLDFGDLGTHYKSGGWITGRVVSAVVRGPLLESLRRAANRFWPPAAAALSRVSRTNETVIDAICATEGKPAFLDGSKDPNRLLQLVRSGRFDVRAIHLVRDGRAITASYKKRHEDTHHCLDLWESKARECEKLKDLLGTDSMLTLRYEDLCLDLPSRLAEIFEFAGLENESGACLEAQTGASVHIIGHASRLMNAKEIKLRQEWQKILTPADLAEFRAREGDLNRKYGYTASGSIENESTGALRPQPSPESFAKTP